MKGYFPSKLSFELEHTGNDEWKLTYKESFGDPELFKKILEPTRQIALSLLQKLKQILPQVECSNDLTVNKEQREISWWVIGERKLLLGAIMGEIIPFFCSSPKDLLRMIQLISSFSSFIVELEIHRPHTNWKQPKEVKHQ